MPEINPYDAKSAKKVAATEKQIDKLYKEIISEMSAIGASLPDFDPNKPFKFSDYPTIKERAEKLLNKLKSGILRTITTGIDVQWALANEKNDELVQSVFGKDAKLTDEQKKQYYSTNDAARQAFIRRQRNGLNLSDRVWKYTNQYKEEIEMALDLGIREGKSADELSRMLRQYLQQPDKLFRRVRDEHGKLQLSKNAKAYHPGMGVYRSSYKNARRLAATETNMAYRSADYERVQQLDFVVGIEVRLSNNHTLNGVPFHDICDELKGKYPKDFKFTGWHPLCRCHAVTILKTEKELEEDTDEILKGEATDTSSRRKVKDVPAQFKNWLEDNSERVQKAKDKGTLPYFLRDNSKYVEVAKKPTALEIAKQRHASRTPEQIQAIKSEWADRRATRKYGKNILSYMSGIKDVDTNALQKALQGGDMSVIMKEADKLKAKGKEILSLNYLDNPIQVARQYSMADAKAVQAAIETKLQKWADSYGAKDWDSVSYDNKVKKLTYEIDWLAANHAGKSWEKTWMVSRNAYQKELTRVMTDKEWNDLSDKLQDLKGFKTTSAQFKEYLAKAEGFITKKSDIDKANVYLNTANAKKIQLEKARSSKKGKIGDTEDVVFRPEDYTQERKDNAVWGNRKDGKTYDKDTGDTFFRPTAEKNWREWDDNQKEVAYLYTSGSSYINEPLYTTYYGTKYGLNGRVRDSWTDINTLTDMIDKTPGFAKDVWLNRGDSAGGFMGQFGLNLRDFQDNPAALVGKEGVQAPFMSTAHTKAFGFVGDGVDATSNVVYNIYCPKGTRGIYTEPYSAFGSGGYDWDGKRKTPLYNELEVILQRGTKLRITKAEYKNGQWFIDMEVIGQPSKKAGVI